MTRVTILLLCGAALAIGPPDVNADEVAWPTRVTTPARSVAITGPERANAGDLVVLEASGGPASAWEWIAIDVPHQNWLADSNGQRVAFSSAKPGRYTFLLVIADVVDGVPVIATATRSVMIEGGNVPPDTAPDLPAGRFQLAKFAWTSASGLPADARKVSWAAAASFRAISSQLAAGAIADSQAGINALADMLKSRLGSQHANWEPFRRDLAKKLSELDEDGKLQSKDDLQQAFEEIATGLEVLK